MKKLILLAVVLLTLTGCGERAKKTVVYDDEIHIKGDIHKTPFVVFEFDGCEYIAFETKGNWRSITHKGNCKYCLERAKKQQQAKEKQ